MLFIVGYVFSTAMKKDIHQVSEHFSHNTENILYGKCTFKVGQMYIANMLLYQLVNFLESDTKEVPVKKANTALLLK